MFKRKNKITPVVEKQKDKKMRRVHKSDDLQKTYELAQQLADEQPLQTVEADCCFCCKVM